MSTSLSPEQALTEFEHLERKLPASGLLRNFTTRFLAEVTQADGDSDDGNNLSTAKKKPAVSPAPLS